MFLTMELSRTFLVMKLDAVDNADSFDDDS